MSAVKGGESLLHATDVKLRMAAGDDGGGDVPDYGDSPLAAAWPAWKAARRQVALALRQRVKMLPAPRESRDE